MIPHIVHQHPSYSNSSMYGMETWSDIHGLSHGSKAVQTSPWSMARARVCTMRNTYTHKLFSSREPRLRVMQHSCCIATMPSECPKWIKNVQDSAFSGPSFICHLHSICTCCVLIRGYPGLRLSVSFLDGLRLASPRARKSCVIDVNPRYTQRFENNHVKGMDGQPNIQSTA